MREELTKLVEYLERLSKEYDNGSPDIRKHAGKAHMDYKAGQYEGKSHAYGHAAFKIKEALSPNPMFMDDGYGAYCRRSVLDDSRIIQTTNPQKEMKDIKDKTDLEIKQETDQEILYWNRILSSCRYQELYEIVETKRLMIDGSVSYTIALSSFASRKPIFRTESEFTGGHSSVATSRSLVVRSFLETMVKGMLFHNEKLSKAADGTTDRTDHH